MLSVNGARGPTNRPGGHMRTMNVDIDRLGPVVLRDMDSEQRVNDEGEISYRGAVIVPGKRAPIEIRLRTRQPYNDGPGAVRMLGNVRLTAWTNGRRNATNSDVTISCDRIERTSDQPNLIGRGVPVELPPMMLLALGRRTAGDDPRTPASLMLPADHYDRDRGAVDVAVAAQPDLMITAQARVVAAEALIRLPDADDQPGRFNKATIIIEAARLDPAALAPAPAPKTGRRNDAEQPGEVTA